MLRHETLKRRLHAHDRTRGLVVDSRKEVLPFNFKRVFDENATQASRACRCRPETCGNRPYPCCLKPTHLAQVDVYNTVAKPIVDDAMKGINGTIFCYGQTGSG